MIRTTIILLLLGLTGKAQITLEHSYNGRGNATVVNIEDVGYKYCVVKAAAYKAELYNTDHSLWKTINLPLSPSKTVISTYYASSKLFDMDSDIEIVLTYYETVGSNAVYTTVIVNEDGSILHTFADVSSLSVVKVDNAWKGIVNVVVSSNNYYSDVYSLPGKYFSIVKEGGDGKESDAMFYPNPMDEVATLSYHLPTGTQNGTIQVYSSAGAMVRSYRVSSQFNDILIHRNELPAGVYTYQLVAPGVSGQSRQFIIR